MDFSRYQKPPHSAADHEAELIGELIGERMALADVEAQEIRIRLPAELEQLFVIGRQQCGTALMGFLIDRDAFEENRLFVEHELGIAGFRKVRIPKRPCHSSWMSSAVARRTRTAWSVGVFGVQGAASVRRVARRRMTRDFPAARSMSLAPGEVVRAGLSSVSLAANASSPWLLSTTAASRWPSLVRSWVLRMVTGFSS
jgi:hypothetical protein